MLYCLKDATLVLFKVYAPAPSDSLAINKQLNLAMEERKDIKSSQFPNRITHPRLSCKRIARWLKFETCFNMIHSWQALLMLIKRLLEFIVDQQKKRIKRIRIWHQSVLPSRYIDLAVAMTTPSPDCPNKQITSTDVSLFGSFMLTLNYVYFQHQKQQVAGFRETLKSFSPGSPLLKVISNVVLIMFQALQDFKRIDKVVLNRSQYQSELVE